LRGQILEKGKEALVLDVGGLSFEQSLNLLQVVVYIVRLLHVLLVAGLEDAPLALLVVEEPQFDLDVHRVLKFLDSLLHGSKVRGEVRLALFLHKWEYDCQLVEEVVDCVQDWMHWQVSVS